MRIPLITCSTLLLFFFVQTAQAQSFLADYKLKWKNAAEYTLEFAQAMPEDQYGYKPVPAEMSFREQLKHIAANMVWLSSSYLKGKHTSIDPTKTGDSKKEIIELLNQAFNYAKQTVDGLQEKDLNEPVDFFAGMMSRRRILLLMTDHVTHHRGQLVVYLRLNDVVPPSYRGW
ncbi:MAG: DinB family protein [Saprospiraceae bacterium]|uniref:DinB family protein n=1 Tax=Candidatus Opimibacter skivensis TaxID=2982028 RepID=A0A9D7SXV8_9BACT|nr:DinB family protein [Candidatus Opimibacter skivensis]